MRQPLEKILRKKLEDTVVKARDIVEIAVNEALQRLGVADSQAPGYLNDEQRALRNTLRAHARQLGDKLTDGKQEIERLANEMAYEHWHRMLFARYLEQNNLLMYDEYTPVTLDECFELAEEEPDCKDGWELAGRLAQKMLPQIFRADSPVFAVKLSINHINELENLISALNPATYQAQDSLGWCYQFWQNKKKKQVNESGVKIGAQELSPVTQLFTEPYMVNFLLDNALGAWWAAKYLTQDDYIRANNEQELRDKASIPGVPLEYLRFIKNDESEGQQKKWTLAAGGYEKWPEHLSQLKTLDPCCGSGHFLVAVFLMLVPMRMQLEGLTSRDAVDAVLLENIHGLELDQRCVELAAFALALEAWRYPNAGGYRTLPEVQLACSGVSIAEEEKDWRDLAKRDEALYRSLIWMQKNFQNAPLLGSLISPLKNPCKSQPPLHLQQLTNFQSGISNETKVALQGLVKTADLLSERYDWVITNVPYLARGKQSEELKKFCSTYYDESKNDLATVFLERCLELCVEGGTSSLVLPQNWLFLTTYKNLREKLLTENTLKLIAKLGPRAFETISGEVVKAILITVLKGKNSKDLPICGVDAITNPTTTTKIAKLKEGHIFEAKQSVQMNNPDYRISFEQSNFELLEVHAKAVQGMTSGDNNQFFFMHWELPGRGEEWEYLQGASASAGHYVGNYQFLRWEQGHGELVKRLGQGIKGRPFWGKKGVSVRQIKPCPVSLYSGFPFEMSCATIFANSDELLPAIYCYSRSPEFIAAIESIDQKLNVTNASLVKIPFDSEYWSSVASEQFPNGLPMLYSDDPTQWCFHGHPCASVVWDESLKCTIFGGLRQDDSVLQVAVARLLGYQWPAELDPQMELAPEMHQLLKKNTEFNDLIDDDGIVCIPAVRGEKTAAKRLEAILYKAYGDEWTSTVEANLLKSVKATDWENWLRDKFFDQHSNFFNYRPFIWHIWDGLKDGFSVLVNYHKFNYKCLERLIYIYLDDWITIQKRSLADGNDGADIRLTAAENLKLQLEAILGNASN
ncbi:N-6 DNA methylase [Pantoea agglomerans]|uniref:Eco57I restriction-modification methylase domain-containing protein n=1 Tax=Enterobacter agglomerans TaxID=549 RepID=UPI00177E9B84|nr:N-6 DNA methylase [Pantoea agglomerans]MBD8243140.1 N-6 DNA methylase [Pantoea agglomerans]